MKVGLQFFVVLILSLGCQLTASKSPNEAGKEEIAQGPESKRAKRSEQNIVPRGFDFANAPEIVAFGSCADQDKPQPIWDMIAKNSPELFIFSGDNIYASKPETKPINAQYKKMNLIPEFRRFRESVPILAVWDDHDFGMSDGGEENPEKDEAKKEFLNNWTYVRDSLKRAQKGIYHSKILGGVQKKSPMFQVVLLDTRWFRSPLKKVEDAENPRKKFSPTDDRKTTILGEEQWAWLEKQLRKPADVRVIVSSIQFVAEDHGYEKWGNFPHEKERFINLLKKTGARNLFFVSGDRHAGTIAKQEIKGWGTLYDITASGINRVSDLEETDKSYVGDRIKAENFGLMHINWGLRKIDLQIRDINNKIVNSAELRIR